MTERDKNMKSVIYTLALAMLALLSSCSDDKVLAEVSTDLKIDYPTNVKNLKVVSEKIEFTNLTSGEKTSVARPGTIRLPEGLYDCVYSADVTYDNGDGTEVATAKGHLTGKAENSRGSVGDTPDRDIPLGDKRRLHL